MQDDPFQKIQLLSGITDITDTFSAPPILSQEEEGVLHETTMLLLDDYLNNNLLTMSNPKFHPNLFNELYQFLLTQLEHIQSNDLEDILLDIVNCSIT